MKMAAVRGPNFQRSPPRLPSVYRDKRKCTQFVPHQILGNHMPKQLQVPDFMFGFPLSFRRLYLSWVLLDLFAVQRVHRNTYIHSSLMFWLHVILFFHFLFTSHCFPLSETFFSHSRHVGCCCAYGLFRCPVRWHDVPLFILLSALQCSIYRIAVNSFRISVKCRISTDTECAGRRRPTTVYHEEHC